MKTAIFVASLVISAQTEAPAPDAPAASAPDDAPAAEPELTDAEAEAVAEVESAKALADAAAPAKGERLVAVLDLKADEGSTSIGNALAQMLTSEVTARDGLKAISRNEIMAVLAHQAEASMMGCEELSCMADIAKLVAADRLVSGTVDRIDDAVVVTLSLIDPAGPAVVERSEMAWRGDPAEAVGLVRPMVDRLFSGPDKSGLVGNLEVFTEDGALVVVDGEERGSAPLPRAVTGLSAGVHVVQISKPGSAPARRDVIVETGQTTILRQALEPEPYYTQWWFWTAVGGGAAVAVAGGTAVAIAALSGDTSVSVKVPLPASVAE